MLFMFFLRFVIGPVKLVPPSRPIRCNPRSDCSLVSHVFPLFRQFTYFYTLNSQYAELSIAPLTFTFVLIGRSNNLWACFRTLFEYVL